MYCLTYRKSTMDVSKLKVTELRAELSERGLDTKGVKAVLVQRLLKAIEEETGEGKLLNTVKNTLRGMKNILK